MERELKPYLNLTFKPKKKRFVTLSHSSFLEIFLIARAKKLLLTDLIYKWMRLNFVAPTIHLNIKSLRAHTHIKLHRDNHTIPAHKTCNHVYLHIHVQTQPYIHSHMHVCARTHTHTGL